MKTLTAITVTLALVTSVWAASTINEPNKFSYGANIGWMNWRDASATNDGVVIGQYFCSGYVWGANVGWINLGDGTPVNGFGYSNASGTDFGVNVQGYFVNAGVQKAKLRGFAYGANIGWINFETTGDPEVNIGTGQLSGYAYGANVGWINLGTFAQSVQTNCLAPGPDTDGDGIPDAFEFQFTNPDTLALLTAAGDFDGDGESDVAEYLAGTNPLNPTDLLKITALTTNSNGSMSAVTFTSNPARRYRIYEDTQLGVAPGFVTTLNNIVPDSGLTMTRSTSSSASLMRFFRVESFLPLCP